MDKDEFTRQMEAGQRNHDKVRAALGALGFENFTVHCPSGATLTISVMGEDSVDEFIADLEDIAAQ